jgi:cell wall-associated NlpC family hydrolase
MNIREQLSAIARTWLGTPFYPHMAKRGIGADCVQLVMAIYKEAGLIPEGETLPKYSLQGGEHLNESIVLKWLSTCGYVQPEQTPGPGSVITFRIGKVDHHVAIMISDTKFIHSARRFGVIEGDLRDPTFAKRLQTCWGPK